MIIEVLPAPRKPVKTVIGMAAITGVPYLFAVIRTRCQKAALTARLHTLFLQEWSQQRT